MADICQTLGRCWANVGQMLGSWWVLRHWADVGGQTVSSINPSPILKQLHLSIIPFGKCAELRMYVIFLDILYTSNLVHLNNANFAS